MAIKDSFIGELKHEASMTKKMLERVPMDNAGWRPHEKSMPIGKLAIHIAETIKWISHIKNIDEFDLSKDFGQRITTATHEELMQLFQSNVDEALAALNDMSDENFSGKWSVKRGEVVMFNATKKLAIRSWAFNHLIHHRGQLSVYLRLLNVAVPGMYGPSADERLG